MWVNSGALNPDTNTVNIVIGDANVAANKNTMQDSDPNNVDDVFLDKSTCAGCASAINLYRNGSGAAAGQSEAIDRQILVDDNNPTLDLLAGFTNGGGAAIGTPAGVPPPPSLVYPGPDDLSQAPVRRDPEVLSPTVATMTTVASIANLPVSKTRALERPSDGSLASSPTTSTKLNHSASTENKTQAGHVTPAVVPVKTASLESANNRSRELRSNHAVRRSALPDQKPATPNSGGQVTINVGTITPGSTAVLNFQVTVNATAPSGANQISNQGSVTSSAPTVLTDDPDTVAANDPTLTPLVHPTAANGVVSGRITTSDGRPVEGAVVRLSGGQSRKLITDQNGKYEFANVETGSFYTVTPSRANYNFNPFNRSFSQTGNQTEAVFTAESMGDNANPLDTAEYFVRQQYVDVLGREPEESGFNYWSDKILACGEDASCVNAQRRDVAAAFFIADEFQASGSYIYDVYAGALGRRPAFSEYSVDRQQVVGGATLDAAKTAFAQNFVQRADFTTRYQNAMTAEAFVDALLQGVQSSGGDLSGERANLIGTYNQGADLVTSRAAVVKLVADNATFKQSQYNQAFVLTEYFAYLRRDAEPGGYSFWVNVLNSGDPGNYRGMVCSFVTSAEYQKRFSQIVSRSNGECSGQ